jgi:methionyl-tRNA formyltransferase
MGGNPTSCGRRRIARLGNIIFTMISSIIRGKPHVNGLKFLYVSRNNNRSGYEILKALLSNEIFPAAVLLPASNSLIKSALKIRILSGLYWCRTKIENSKPLKFFGSEYLIAKKARIPIFQTLSIHDPSFLNKIKDEKYDLIFLGGGWPELLPYEFYSLARLGALNTHPSLLPNFRGTSITRWQVLHGVTESGITIHQIAANFDAGPVIAQSKIEVSPNLTPQELFERLSHVGAKLACELIQNISHTAQLPVSVPQASLGTYFQSWNWDEDLLRIDLKKTLRQIHQFILANTQEEYSYTGPKILLNGQEFFVRETEIIESEFAVTDPLLKNSEIYFTHIKDKFLRVIKVEDHETLIIKKIQKVQRGKVLNRAKAPAKFFSSSEKVSIDEC